MEPQNSGCCKYSLEIMASEAISNLAKCQNIQVMTFNISQLPH